MARRAISTGVWPATIGSVATPTCSPSTRSCSCAAGRRVSSEAISTFFFCRSVRRRASLAVVVVLPEPCRPTIISGTGAGAFRSIGTASAPSVSTSWSWTIFTTIWPGFTERISSAPTAFSRTWSTKPFTTSSATSASSNARRTSRSALSTSPADSAPRPVILSKMPLRRSERDSNKQTSKHHRTRGRKSLADADLRDQRPGRRVFYGPVGIWWRRLEEQGLEVKKRAGRGPLCYEFLASR